MPFAEQLRAELVAAAERRLAARRHRRRLAFGGAAAAALGGAAAALLLAVVPQPTAAAADVEVRIGRRTIAVALAELEHRPERIERALQAAGLAVEVRAVPVGPSNVGRFVGHESDRSLPPELERLDASGESFRGFSLPLGWPGALHLLVGKPAGRHEPYTVFSDATQPGEPLACQPVVGRPLRAVADLLAEVDRAVRGLAVEGTEARSLSAVELAAPGWASWTVASVHAISDQELVVQLVPPGAPLRPASPIAGCAHGTAR
jgi:hypothetical protein